MNEIVEKVESFLEKYSLKDNNSSAVLIAFSGGYDSMCLLHIIHTLGVKNVTAIHLNHNWRGNESLADENRCRVFCEHLGINFYSETLPDNVPRTETAARNARYAFFEKCAKMFKAKAVLTAHNSDDNAETVLYRIAKGTGLEGLCGILPVRDIFYRPLLKVSRKDIENYCSESGLCPNIDSSNEDTRYRRNLVRHEILPLLRQINPDVSSAINSLSELAVENFEYINSKIPANGGNTLDFVNLDSVIQKKIIKDLLVKHDVDYDRKKIELLLKFIHENSRSKSGKRYSLSDELFMYVNKNIFKVVKKNIVNDDVVPVREDGEYILGDYIFTISECRELPEGFPPDSANTAYVSLDKANLTLRTRRDGDIIHPLGAEGKQKLKKYLNGKKIPSYKKDKLIFLCRGNEVLWAPGIGISENIKVDKRVTNVLKVVKKEN